MDGDGIPLAFSIHKGNTNEQVTLKPLEQKILADFHLSRFVVCTDAGLASEANRRFNTQGERSYLTTQSIKKLKAHLRQWALDPTGWFLPGDKKRYDLRELDEDYASDKVFYKERWLKENGREEKLIVTYSIKYKTYLRTIRNRQIERAEKMMATNPRSLSKHHQNDAKRFVVKQHCTKEGEVSSLTSFSLNRELIAHEEAFDGFYAVCTNWKMKHRLLFA